MHGNVILKSLKRRPRKEASAGQSPRAALMAAAFYEWTDELLGSERKKKFVLINIAILDLVNFGHPKECPARTLLG